MSGLDYLAQSDPAQYFLANSVNYLLASAMDFQQFLDLVGGNLSHAGAASLNKFVGKLILESENPRKAAAFLNRSVEIYRKLRKEVDPTNFLLEMDMLSEAEILLAQCYIRNCERYQDAEILLAPHFEVDSASPTSQSLINALTAHLVAVESRLATHTEISTIPDHINVCKDMLTKMASINVEALLAELEVLAYNYFCLINSTGLIQESFVRIHCLVNFCGPLSQFCALKAIFRNRYIPPVNIIPLCPIFVGSLNAKQQQSCTMANVHFVMGKLHVDNFNYTHAMSAFRECLRIRNTELGEHHASTAIVKVTLANLLIETAKRSEPLPSEVFSLMEESFSVFRNRSHTKFMCFADGLNVFGIYFSDSGNLKLAETYLKEAIEVETSIRNSENHECVTFRRVALGKAYLQYKKWDLAKGEFLLAIADLSCKIGQKETLICGEALAFCGYCFFKLGDFGNAKIHFDWSKEKFSTFNQGLEVSNLFLVLMLFNAEFLLLGLQKRDIAKQIAITAFSYCLGNKNFCHVFHPEVYHTLALLREEFDEEDLFPLTSRALYEESLKIGEQKFFSYHPYMCDSFLALAKLDFKENEMEMFEYRLTKGLEIAFKIYGPNDESIRMIFSQFEKLTNLRELVQKDYAKFSDYMNLCTQAAVGSNCEFIALFCAQFAQHLFETKMGNCWVDRCCELFSKSHDFFKRALGDKNEKTAKTEQMVGLCYLKMGKLKKAEWHLFHSAISLMQ